MPGLKGVRVSLYRGQRRVSSVRTHRNGRFSLRGRVGTPDLQYTVRYGGAVSNAVGLVRATISCPSSFKKNRTFPALTTAEFVA